MYIYVLSKENPSLAYAEARANSNIYESNRNILRVKSGSYRQLSFTQEVLELLVEASKDDVIAEIKSIDWRTVLTGSFKVRMHSNNHVNIQIADIIWKSSRRRVDIRHPDSELVLVQYGRRYLLGKSVWKNPRTFEHRKAHMRPVLQPISLHPRLAKACVNLLGPGKHTILDPFCGTGGILIEAGLLGHPIVGYDIDQRMLSACRKNLNHYKISGKLEPRDALAMDDRYKYIVTDLPYGKNTREVPKDLYRDFLVLIKKNRCNAVIIFPDCYNYRKTMQELRIKITAEFTQYIHKSMSKKIIVIKTR